LDNLNTSPIQAEYYFIDDPSLIPSFPPTFDSLDTSATSLSSNSMSSKKSRSASSSSRKLLQRQLEKRGEGLRGVTNVEVAVVLCVLVCLALVVILLLSQKLTNDTPPAPTPHNNSIVAHIAILSEVN
jgi:hypothetical protein